MDLLIQRLFDGLFNGAIYASLALALVMIYRSTGLLNLAQGELATFGAYLALVFAAPASAALAGGDLVSWIPGHPWPMWAAIALAVLVSMVMGAGIERTVFRGLESRPELAQINVTIGLLILFSGLTEQFWGTNGRFIPSVFPTEFDDFISIGGGRLRYSTIGAWAMLLVILLLLNLLIRHTKLGLAFRAVTSNREGAALVGIPVSRTLMFGWAVAAGLGTVASTLVAGVVLLEPTIMLKLLIYSLAAATLGGLDSPKGAIVGGVVVAQAQTLVPGYLGLPTELAVVPAVAVMLVILLVGLQGSLEPDGLNEYDGSNRDHRRRLSGRRTPNRAPRPKNHHHRRAAGGSNTDHRPALRRFSQVLVLVLAVLGVNFCTGYVGLVSLGHGVFVGVGAFAMANFLDDLSLPFLPAFLLATATAGLFWVILGLPALRIKGIYLALLTFGFALAFGPITRRLGSITGGVNGRNVEFEGTPPSWTGLGEDRTQLYRYILCVLVVVIWFVLVHSLINSRMGRAMRAVKDDETAAASFGVDLTIIKTGAFGISAAMAGSAGAMQTFLFPFVSHTKFDVFLSLRLYAAAVIGGLGTLVGAVYGVASLLVVPFMARILGSFGSETVVFGLALILLTYIAPTGLAGLADRFAVWFRSRRE